MSYQVFICHSSTDKQVADAVCTALEERGIGCWIAPRDVLAGVEYGEAIVNGIVACPIVLVVFSQRANDSPQVRREIERAVSKAKTIVPFRIENVLPTGAMEYALSNTHWLDALEPPVQRYLPTLSNTVATLIERARPVPTAVSSDATGLTTIRSRSKVGRWRIRALSAAALVALAVAVGYWMHLAANRTWARSEAIPQITSLLEAQKRLAAAEVLSQARKYLPANPQLTQMAEQNEMTVSVHSDPTGAKVEIADYVTPDAWHFLGVTPLDRIQIPKGYFRWRVSKPGVGELLKAPETKPNMDFQLAAARDWPKGMVFAPGGIWADQVAFIGWMGPFQLPAYYVDRFEVTNREYQVFVDNHGYETRKYWPAEFKQGDRTLSWEEAITQFRDTTERPGPATWVGGHFPEGKADYPVSGVSWFEAQAYAAFAGKSLPVLAQWLNVAPPDLTSYVVPASNIVGSSVAPVGKYDGLGPLGTYDTAGNLSEWVANTVDDGMRFVLGGSWKSPGYQYFSPQTVSPFDRSAENGFRCVKNLGPIPAAASAPLKRLTRDFSQYRPVQDSVFQAYKLLYAYPNLPLHVVDGGIVQETVDWREEKVTFDTGYRGERMSAYLFLPKRARPPYQSVLFFPSARVYFRPDNDGGRQLVDLNFFDYVVQSGRAVVYPIYEGTYERALKFSLPSGSQSIELTTDWYKEAARTLDYLATRSDIDSSKLAYLGVSMGSADGVIVASLLQDRLKTAVLLDGGYFMDTPPAGADQADFVTRLKKPVLMVNGRYDFTFPLETSQNPFFAMLGTAQTDKRHVVLDTPHDVTEQRTQLTRIVLDWLDAYMGRVQ